MHRAIPALSTLSEPPSVERLKHNPHGRRHISKAGGGLILPCPSLREHLSATRRLMVPFIFGIKRVTSFSRFAMCAFIAAPREPLQQAVL